MKDAEWLAELIRHGLVRHRKALAGNQAAERNRTLTLLESAGRRSALLDAISTAPASGALAWAAALYSAFG